MKKNEFSSVKESIAQRGPSPLERSGINDRGDRDRKPFGEGVRLGETRNKFDKFVKEVVEKSRQSEFRNERNWEHIKEYANNMLSGYNDRIADLKLRQYQARTWSIIKIGATGAALFTTSGLGALVTGPAFTKSMTDLSVHWFGSPEQSAQWSDSNFDLWFDPIAASRYGGLRAIGLDEDTSSKTETSISATKDIVDGLKDLASKGRSWTSVVGISEGIYNIIDIGTSKPKEKNEHFQTLP